MRHFSVASLLESDSSTQNVIHLFWNFKKKNFPDSDETFKSQLYARLLRSFACIYMRLKKRNIASQTSPKSVRSSNLVSRRVCHCSTLVQTKKTNFENFENFGSNIDFIWRFRWSYTWKIDIRGKVCEIFDDIFFHSQAS